MKRTNSESELTLEDLEGIFSDSESAISENYVIEKSLKRMPKMKTPAKLLKEMSTAP